MKQVLIREDGIESVYELQSCRYKTSSNNIEVAHARDIISIVDQQEIGGDDKTLDRPIYVCKDGSQWFGTDFEQNRMTKNYPTKKELVESVGGDRTTTVSQDPKVYQIIYEV